MRWEAANVAPSSSRTDQDVSSSRKSSETVEAALARLTKAYSTAMSCLGAIHKLQAAAEKEGPKDEFKTPSQKLATAARTTFEKAVLLDPLIAKFSPTWTRVVKDLAQKQDGDKWSFVGDPRPEPAVLTSSSHKNTIREIAYLSLLNYADLLVASQQRNEQTGSGILDNGVVKTLPLIGWEDDSDQQLALVSLCDASELDGSDPVVWLKLACAARRYSIVLGEKPLRYKRLERHALEMGKTALPPTVPPNRSIVRALKEHESLQDVYNDKLEEKDESPTKLVLDIPRYSWSILGRMLIRACREGVKPDSREAFGSPCVELHLSPMLSLPQRSLGVICKYLQNEDIWRFEATCRGLSAAILSARALLERKESAEIAANEQVQVDTPALAAQSDTNPLSLTTSEQTSKNESTDEKKRDEPARSRSSKRVLSQLITSGKRSEREAKRGSVKHCLLASTLHCTSDEDLSRKVPIEDINWDTLYKSFLGSTQGLLKGAPENTAVQSEGATVDARLGDSCLTAFINKWSTNNSGPFDILQRYVTHVALNVVEVFQSDQDSLALSSFIIDCVDILARKAGICHDLDLCSYGHVDLNPGGEMTCGDYFAVNLLNAELRLKRSDGQLTGFGDYDADSNFVAVVVPELLHRVTEIETALPTLRESSNWISLKTRLHWLAAGFYLDRSRLSQNICESRTAEDFGIEQVERTIECLALPAGSPISSVKTPHLTSPRRTGYHWKVLSMPSLAAFRDDIQASSVVSGARQQFLEKLTEIETRWQTVADKTLRTEDSAGLLSVATTLFQRYDVTYQEEGAKHEELLEDFIASCEDELSGHLASVDNNDIGENHWGSLWFLAPSGAPHIDRIIDVPNPSILTILMTCLNASEENRLPVAQLITRIAICCFELLAMRKKGNKVSRNTPEDEFDDLSDDGMLSDDDVEMAGGSDQRKDFLVAIAAEFFLDKIVYMFDNHFTDLERRQYASSQDCLVMIRSSMAFVSNWYEPRGSRRSTSSTGTHDLRTFVSVCSLKEAITRNLSTNTSVADAEVAFFLGFYRILVCQRHLLPIVLGSGNDNRSGRSAKQKEFLGRTELVGAALSEIAIMLSLHSSSVNGGYLRRSPLLGGAFSEEESGGSSGPQSLAALVEALLYFWNVVHTDDVANTGSVLGKICTETLLIPVAASIVGLCGSALCSFSRRGDQSMDSSTLDRLSLREFFDSDASANEYDSDEEEVGVRSRRKMDLLQPLCHAIQCISLIVDNVDESLALRYSPKTDCEREKGSFFPLVATRVLSFQADLLLTEFGDKVAAEENLWQSSFPHGTRTIGMFLDSALHRVYKQLYGFTIHGHWIEKEKTCDDKCKSVKRPESTKAAAQLYRCIQRAYTLSRKSVPKAALECVSMALPEAEASPRRNAMKSFVFDKETKTVSSKSISRLAGNDSNWDKPFKACYEAAIHLNNERTDEDFKDEIRMVRKGIARELAQAPLPNISKAGADGTKGSKSEENQKTSEERALSAFQERELSKKFWAIIDDMSYDDPSNCHGWLRAAECLGLKADLIADRLGSSLGLVRVTDFSIPMDNNSRQKKLLSLADLKEAQEREYIQSTVNWTPYIGDDLSIYVDYQWSSFTSLENCAQVAATKYRELATRILNKSIDNESSEFFETHVWNEIETMHKNNEFIGWQQAWGGMFVEALRTIASRCLCMGFFLIGDSRNTSTTAEATSLQSEILESLGIAKYTELMGSQGFGYPMRVLSDHKKREIAEAAQQCFQEAAMKVADDNDQFTFDVMFMVGKCYEKVAKTFATESFLEDLHDGKNPPRSYERKMERALSIYHKSLEEATALDEEGALPDVHAGGSSHGKTEVIYRLHASRLKCLISAVQYPENVREKAIAEAVRLTRCNWYGSSHSSIANDVTDVNMVWTILADIVAALAQCRLDHQFFHRSVYRYAQALMWAPALHDPATGIVNGSLGLVPATKSHLIRGLNSSTACANSAEVIMATLFERKRPQLVSVWVTNTSSSPSPLEAINNSTRKFDSLRGKYFQAYVETLRLCKRTSILDTLFQQVASTKRDLHSFYQASALVRGAIPEASHAKDNLLRNSRSFHTLGLVRGLKRIINRALAAILIEEAPPSDPKNDYIKKCYTSYLRLNTTIEEAAKMRSWRYSSNTLPEVEALCQAYLARSERKALSFESFNWTGGSNKTAVLKAAVERCSELFPSLANTLYRRSKPKKASANKSEADENDDGPESKKRSAPEKDSLVQFVVDVPPGLEVGDKFETTVRIGSQMKTLRLTVPVGLPPKLKFSLKAPDEEEGDSSSKRQKED